MVPQVTAPWPRPGPGVSGDGDLRSRSDLTFILLGMARLVWALQSPLYWRGPCYQEAACYHLRRHDNSLSEPRCHLPATAAGEDNLVP